MTFTLQSCEIKVIYDIFQRHATKHTLYYIMSLL